MSSQSPRGGSWHSWSRLSQVRLREWSPQAGKHTAGDIPICSQALRATTSALDPATARFRWWQHHKDNDMHN